MALTPLTLAELERRILAFFRVRFASRDLGTESYLGKKARAMAMGLLLLQKAMVDISADAIPSSATSTAALDQWALLLGLPNGDGSNGYGRKGATAASGGAGNVTGTKGTVVADQQALIASDGVTRFVLDGSVTVPGSAPGKGSIAGIFTATTTGPAGNLPAGSVLSWVSTPSGIDSTVTLTGALTGALDGETNAELLGRILYRLQNPPKGGVASDFRAWAEAADTRVARAYPYPLRGGLGTEHNVIVGYGSSTARGFGAIGSATFLEVQAAVDAYINGDSTHEGTRPITTEGYTTLQPYMPGTHYLLIVVRVVPSQSKYAFDWIDTAGHIVDTYTADAPATLKLGALAPASLKAAITAGLKPRLQVLSTTSGASAVNPQVRATGYSDGGGKTTLTLENPLPSGFIGPTAGDIVHAGGPMVATIQQLLLNYIDSLGPSRSGGYAAPYDQWEDTCAVARLAQIALDATDADGTRFASNILPGATFNVTIAQGAGSALPFDVTATDSTVNGPELLYAKTIAVIQ